MNRKLLYSPIGLMAIAAALVLAVAGISLLPGLRIDLTEDRLYTLSAGSRNILANLQQPLKLMFFYSESATEDQPQIRSYGTRVQELLREVVIASSGRLSLSVIDPAPFSEDEDLATRYGIQAIPVSPGGEAIYFGLVVAADVTLEEADPAMPASAEIMPLIRPDQEQFLEYELMKLIVGAANPQPVVVGLITGLDMDGGFNPALGQATPPWFVMDLVRQLYQVRRIPLSAERIDADVDILLLVHPRELSESLLYAIDQYVMGGGETLVFLDPNADSMVSLSTQGALIPAGMSSNLPGLLSAWGIDYAEDKVLTDNQLALRVRMSQTERPVPHLGMLGVQRQYLAPADIITSGLETINLSSSGVIAQAEGATTRFEPLLVSSPDSMLMDRGLLENVTDPSALFDTFESGNQSHVIAARITGVMQSAFPDGPPPVPPDAADQASAGQQAEAAATAAIADADTATPDSSDSPDAMSPATPAEITVNSLQQPAHLASSAEPVSLIVFADSDVLTDRLWVQLVQFLGQRIPQPFANNGDLLINALDNLRGGTDLVSIRSRGTYSRPFTRVQDLQRQADDRLRREETELQAQLAETESSLAQLNQDEEGNPLDQITPEIQAEIDRFNARLLDTRRRLRDVQFQLTEDIDRLGSILKAINTALIPLLLTLLALVAHYVRGRRAGSLTRMRVPSP